MPESIINEKTEESIKSYLQEKGNEINKSDNFDFQPVSKKNNPPNKNLILGVILVLFFVFIYLAYYTFSKGQNSFDEKKVAINISAPRDVSSGKEFSLEIEYENKNEVAMNNPTLVLSVPKDFVFVSSYVKPEVEKAELKWTLANVEKKGSGKIKLFGKIIGKKDSEHKLSYKMSYKPSNINSEYKTEGNAKIKVTSIPFELTVKSASEVDSGAEVEYSIKYKNISEHPFPNIKIKALFPKEFIYQSSDPVASKEAEDTYVWNINNVGANTNGDLKINGNLSGNKDEEKKATISLEAPEADKMFEYLSENTVTKVKEIPITLEQTVNGEKSISIDKNTEIEYKIKFKNVSDAEIKGLVINSELEGNFDPSSINVINGSFDGKNKITWSAFNVPKLAVLGSKEEDAVNFRVKVKDIIDIKSSNDKNFVIKNKATIKNYNFDSNSSDVGKTIASSESETKINAFPIIKALGYYNDDGRIKNSGVVPPEVGKETSYTIHWNLANLFNDVSNIRIISVLPEGVSWTGNYINYDGKVSLGDDKNGIFMQPIAAESSSISDIKKSTGENKLEIAYYWFDKTVLNNENNKGLPAGLTVGDELEFIYDDGAVKQNSRCIIMEDETRKGHSYFCSVPWNIELPLYDKKEDYKIRKAVNKIEAEKFYYNPETREIIWEIPKADANMGVLTPAKEVVFQIKIVPKEIDVGKVMKIESEVKLSGHDDFTGKKITTLDSELNTDLPDDESIGLEEGIVIPDAEGQNVNGGNVTEGE